MPIPVSPPPDILVEPAVRLALREDLGRAGDITTQYAIPEGARQEARLVARADGYLAGMSAARIAFQLMETDIVVTQQIVDGGRVTAGDTLALVTGSTHAVLAAERVALNFLGHLSGVATATATLVDAVAGTGARICCTRKTTPGLRLLEKHAVVCGGGVNHRSGLDDGLLVKDNHIAAAGGITRAVSRIRERAGHMLKLEVEVDTLEQLTEALTLDVDAVLLDNMELSVLAQAVAMVDGRMVTEASGGITRETVRAVAETGVNFVSTGWITHSAPALDVALDIGP